MWVVRLSLASVALSALACGIGSGQVDTQATVQAVYLTITAQASTGGASAATGNSLSPVPETSVTSTPETQEPTVTPTAPESRTGNGLNLTFSRCTAAFTVDGDDTDWQTQSTLSRFALTDVPFGRNEWLGPSDLSGYARLCWSDSALHLFVEVTDDIHVQTEQGRTAWQGDEVELLFDSDLHGDFYDDVWGDDDTQIGLSPGDFADRSPAAFRYHPNERQEPDVQIAARRSIGPGGNYVLEAAIPWVALDVAPQASYNYGFCLAISDNDHVGVAQQDSLISHCQRLSVFDPTTWITVALSS